MADQPSRKRVPSEPTYKPTREPLKQQLPPPNPETLAEEHALSYIRGLLQEHFDDHIVLVRKKTTSNHEVTNIFLWSFSEPNWAKGGMERVLDDFKYADQKRFKDNHPPESPA